MSTKPGLDREQFVRGCAAIDEQIRRTTLSGG